MLARSTSNNRSLGGQSLTIRNFAF